ncbi:MAG: GTP pyrophosphokinase [Eubacterium sp.]|nr:GTP pyrophosphokinase [Eubacterium sp.]
MIYTPMTKKAMKLMFEKQKNQVDKSGLPYIFHPFHVAEQMKNEVTTIVALLHDLLEDTEVTVAELEQMGFTKEVTDALKTLTRTKTENYFDYIRRIGENPVARAVKIKDLEHNMDLTRLEQISERDLERLEKYKKSYQYLMKIE